MCGYSVEYVRCFANVVLKHLFLLKYLYMLLLFLCSVENNLITTKKIIVRSFIIQTDHVNMHIKRFSLVHESFGLCSYYKGSQQNKFYLISFESIMLYS